MNFSIFSRIKKAARTTAIFIKRIPNINFKSKQEIIELYEWGQEMDWADHLHRRNRFQYFASIFELNLESRLTDDESKEKHQKQYELLWKLVDLEGGQNE